MSDLPPCRVLVRTKQDLELFYLGNAKQPVKLLDKCATTIQTISSDGRLALVHIASHGVVKVDLQNPEALPGKPDTFLQGTAGVQMMHLSPHATFVLTWERFNAETCPRNLKVWDVATGKLLAGFPQKNLSRASWPYLQWTVDEQYAFLMASTQVRVYAKEDIETTDFGQDPRYIDRLQMEGSNISVPQESAPSSSVSYLLTTFTAKSKNKAATASIYEYSKVGSFQRKASKSLFQAEECVTHWSPRGTSCLLSLQTAVDSSGQSYYGSSLLFLWNGMDDVIAVSLPQEGPVQAVSWIPKPVSFIAIAGRMPAMGSLHHGQTGAVTFLFGNNVHRNTVAVSPHARFLCLAGFGNLAGGMGFWDLNKKRLLPHIATNASGQLKADSTVIMHSWAPDSRSFLVATTAPRMNVDNGINLYKYTGEQISADQLPWNNQDYLPNKLLEACFVPTSVETYPDRPQSPPPEGGSEVAPQVEVKKPAGRYIPPSARGRSGGTILADRLRKEKEGKLTGATAVTTKMAAATIKPSIPGMTSAVVPGTKSKSQLKREKMKKKKEEQEKAEELLKIQAAQKPAEETTSNEPVDPAKRARKIKKLLKQIDDLKGKDDLNDDQKMKLENEASLREELATLE